MKIMGQKTKPLIYHILISIISLVISFFFIITGVEAYKEYAREQGYNGVSTGYVIKKHYQRASDGNSIYYLDYWFAIADGRRINSTNRISKENWDHLKTNDALGIRYDQADPNRNIPLYGGHLSPIYIFFIAVFGIVFLVFGVMRIFTGVREVCKKSDAEEGGTRVLPGKKQ